MTGGLPTALTPVSRVGLYSNTPLVALDVCIFVRDKKIFLSCGCLIIRHVM